MMSITLGSIVVMRHNQRSIPIQPMNDSIYYAALLRFGIRESVAAAATKGIITISVKELGK